MQTHSSINQPILTNEAFAALGGPSLVYVRQIKAHEVPELQPASAMKDAGLRPDQTLYAVYRGVDGQRLAILTDRDSAYAAALANELAPVSVH